MPTERMKLPKPADLVRFRVTYSIELARGSSIISSALKTDTRRAAIAEIADEFRAFHGSAHVLVFLDLLEEKLTARHAPEAAEAVRGYRQSLSSVGQTRTRRTVRVSAQ
jgi:hypothetical protein